MIPILYEKTETAFTSNGLGRLSDASSFVVTEERNGIFEFEMVYPVTGVHFDNIQVDRFVKTICNAKKQPQLFRIYAITKPINGKCTIRGEHISYQMLHIPLMPFSAVGAAATMAAIPSHAVGDCPFSFVTDIASTRTYTLNYPKSLRGALQGDQWSILQNFGGDYEWDNWTVRLLANRGQDKGVILRYGKNITDLKQEENIQQTYTGIVPYWYGLEGEEEVLVTLPEEVIYASTAANFPYTRVLAVDFTDQIQNKPTLQELRDAANHYIDRNEIGYPSVSISLNFVDLSQTEEYKDLAVETLNLCDLITVQFEQLGISKKAKITRTKYDVLKERYTNLYIGESYHSLASIIADQSVATEEVHVAARNKIASAIDQATTVINGDVTGSAMKTLTDANGNPLGLIFLDTYNESTAVNCIRININGMGFSTVGPNGPYDTAIYYDSTLGKWVINSNYLNVVNLSADNITSGTLSSAEIDIGNGNFTVDSYGNMVAKSADIQGGSININTSSEIFDAIILAYHDYKLRLSTGSLTTEHNKETNPEKVVYNTTGLHAYINNNVISYFGFTSLGGSMFMDNIEGKNVVSMQADSNGGHLRVTDPTGQYGLQADGSTNGGATLNIRSVNGSLISIQGTGNNSFVTVRDLANNKYVVVAGNYIRLYGANSTRRVELDEAGLRFYSATGVLTKTYSAT